MLNESEMKQFNGFEVVEKNGKYKYVTDQSIPLSVIVREKGESYCSCGGELFLLTYIFYDGQVKSNKIAGKKCSQCGRNFFSPKSVKNKEHFFEFIKYDEYVLEETVSEDVEIRVEEPADENVCEITAENHVGQNAVSEESNSLEYSEEVSNITIDIDTKIEQETDVSESEIDFVEIERSHTFPPLFPEVNMVEKLAADRIPTDAGAWWIMLQTSMSIYNYAVVRDPVNNSVLDEFWHDVSKRENDGGAANVVYAANDGGVRPLPYDDLMAVVNYCGDPLHYVFNNPRHSIVKVDKMVTPYRVRNTGTRTMDWLGKQPGKTIKEKLSGKNKMLTQVNEYSYDIKENQVAIMLYRQIMKRINERVNSGVMQGGYDESVSTGINKMLKLKKILRNSSIADAKPTNHIAANNVLLADKNYSIIWKAYLEMCKYDKHIEVKWNKALEMYVESSFIAICAILVNYVGVQTIEERVNLSEEGRRDFKCIVGYDSDSPLLVNLSAERYEIRLSISNVNERGTRIIKQYKMLFSGDTECDLMAKRGYPVNVTFSSDEEISELKIWADMDGICSIISWCIFRIEELYGQALKYNNENVHNMTGTCTFDIISNGDYTTLDDQRISSFYDNIAVVYGEGNAEDRAVYKGNKNSVYPSASGLVNISDAVDDRLQTEALMQALEDIRNKVDLKQDDYFIYTVPDALEEFSQKNLKQCVKAWFPRTFPVWRSVAALTDILMTEKENFEPTDVFVSVDLMGEVAIAGLLSIKHESRVNGYVCNHFPPFPESDAGEYVTEIAFLENYVEKFFKVKEISVNEDIVKQIVKSGIARNVLLDGNAHNYTIVKGNSVRVVQLDYDEAIIANCKNAWLSNFKRFWKDVKYRIPKNIQIQFVNILSDCVMNCVSSEEVKAVVGTGDKFVGIYFSTSSNINLGAYTYIERLRTHKPTWTEYLPELSLEVIKDGSYVQLELIGDDVSFDVMGEDNEHIVEEQLILKAGEPEFRFPLIKKDISRKSSLIEAYITDKSFPLDHDVIVALSVRYKYGFDNSYELTLRPINAHETAFEEIIVEWTNVSREANVVNIWPPKTNLQPNENVLKEIEETRDSLIKVEFSIRKHMVNYVGVQDKSYPIKQTDRFLNRNIFKLRNIVLSDLPEAHDFIQWFISTDLYKYLGQIAGLFRSTDIPEDFYRDNQGKELEYFRGDCLQVMFSIGVYIPDVIQRHYVSNYYEYNDKVRIKAMVDLLLKNGGNTAAIVTLIDEIRNSPDENTYSRKMDGLVKELGKMCCFDSDLIYAFYGVDQSFINEMISYIINGMKKQLLRCERYGETYDPRKQDRKRYIGYLEAILAILRLRDPDRTENFDALAAGSDEAKRLSNTIRQLDVYMKHPHSSVRFKLTSAKPESLSKMSDLTYALDLYLNGDKRAASIEVVGVDEDEDD